MTKLKYCYSHLKSFDFLFWIALFMFLNHFSTHTLQIHFFHPISFFSSQMHSLISFKSYTVSCITNLDNSVHPFHPSSSSFFFAHSLPVFIQNAVQHHSSFFINKEMHIATHPFSTHHTISILSVLLQCDSAINVLSIHPSLITPLFNQLLNKIITMFSDSSRISKSADWSWAEMPRSQWIAVCIHSIKKMICTSPDGL